MNSTIVMSNRPKNLNTLTSLRFVAAVIIVIHHSKCVTGMDFKWLMHLQTYQPVSFFFVLSGFILAYVYPSLRNSREICQFLIARFSRLWPLHVFKFLLVVIIFPANLRNLGGDDSLWVVLLNLCMFQSWIPIWNYYFSCNALSWAISTEFAFYLFFPWLIYAWKRTWGVKLLITFLMVAAIVWYANITGMPSGQIAGTTDRIGYSGLVYTGPFSRVFEFTLGMVLALMYARLKTRRPCSKAMASVIEASALIMAFGMMIISEFLANFLTWIYPWIGESGRIWLLVAGLPCGFYGLLILVMAMENGMISKFLSRKIFMRLGEMSLSIFLLHQILVRYYHWRIEKTAILPEWFFIVYLWGILLPASYLAMAAVENPSRRFILKIWSSIEKYLFHLEGTEKFSHEIKLNNIAIQTVQQAIHNNRDFLVAGALLSAILLSIFGYLNGALVPMNAIDQTSALKMMESWSPQYRQISFGDKFILRGADIDKISNGVQLKLIWESMGRQHLKYRVAVHVLDADGKIITQADYMQNNGNLLVASHLLWLDKAEIPQDRLTGARRIGIAIYSPETMEFLHPDRGDRDWDNQRLNFDIPKYLIQESVCSVKMN